MKTLLLAAAVLAAPLPAAAKTWYSPDFSNNTCETLEVYFPNLGIHAPSDFYNALKQDGYPVTEDEMHNTDGSLKAVALNIKDIQEGGLPIFFTMWDTLAGCNKFMLGVQEQGNSAPDDGSQDKSL
jgi:hypothetical protein